MLRAAVMLCLSLIASLVSAQDSLKLHAGSDSLSAPVIRYKQSLDSTERRLTHCIDSLHRLHLPATHYQHQLDSIRAIDPLKAVRQQQTKVLSAERQATQSITSVEQKTTGSIASVENKLTQKLISAEQNAGGSISGSGLPAGSVPNASIPGISTPSVPSASLPYVPNTSLPGLNLPSGNNLLTDNPVQKEWGSVGSLPQKEMGELTNAAGGSAIQKDLTESTQISKQAQGYGKEISGTVKGDSASRAKLEKQLETRLQKEIPQQAAMPKEMQQLDQLKKLGGDPAALEKDGLGQLKKQAVNHFAGHEQELQSGMQRVSALKRKYSSINGLDQIPKRVPNPMHGKPLLDRLVPGIAYQLLTKGHDPTGDINLYLGYKFNKRLTAGLGWNQRFDFRHLRFGGHQRYFGPRSYADFKIKGGLSFRGEAEIMNTLVPPNQIFVFGDRPRQWVWNSFAGIKKDYRLFRRFKGNTQLLYNINSLFDKHHLNLYGDPVSARIGFELPLHKKAKATAKKQMAVRHLPRV